MTLSRKVTLLLACLGGLLLIFASLAFFKLRSLEGTYARLFEDDARALLVIPQINVTLHDAARLAVQRANARNREDASQLEREFQALIGEMEIQTGKLRSALPEYSRQATEIDQAFKALLAVGLRIRTEPAAGPTDHTLALLRGEFKARFDRIREYLRLLGDQIHRSILVQARDAEARSTRVVRRTLFAGVLALTVGLVLGQFWVWYTLSRPLRSLVTVVRRLVAGDTGVQISGARRGDEIGLLASALGVFRETLVRRFKLEEEERETIRRLQSSEARFRSLIEAAPDAFIITDSSHRIVDANRQAERLFGWTREELLGQHSTVLIPERLHEEAAVSTERLGTLSEKLPGAAVELIGLRKDRSEFPIELAYARIETNEGDPLFCASVRDVTERRRTETELANKVAFQKALIDSIPYPIFIKDHDARFLGCNRAYEETFGTTARQIRGKTVLDLPYLPEADRERFHAEDTEALRTMRPRTYELSISFVDGRTHVTLYSVNAFALADGSAGGLIGLLVDISDRKAAEEELRRSQQLLQSVIDNAAAYVFVKDAEGRYLLVNELYAALLKRPASELLGRTAFDVFPADAAATFTSSEEEVKRTGLARTSETSFVLDGEVRCALAHRFPLFDADGQLFGIGGVSTDITEIKRTQRELAQARDAAEAANRAKSAFVATMSHEIRTPMNAIINLTALTLETELSPRQRQYLTVVQSSARGLLALLNDILDFSKIEAERLELEKAPFELRVLLEEVADSFRGRVLETRIEFGVLVGDDVPEVVVGDTLRLRQVLINLLGNAFKFTERGEIDVRVSRVEHHAGTSEDPGSVTIRFAVRDTGIGIPAEKLGRLFEAFSQADSSTSRKFGGTGLGLAISRRLVELMRGTIEVQSQLGRGSEFIFTARFDLPHAMEVPARAAAPTHGLQYTRALVIEPSDLTREVIIGMLQRFGLTAEGVASGEEGIQKMNQAAAGTPFGLVVLDWLLPDGSGVEFGRRIRRLPSGEATPLVMVSAYSGEQEEELARSAGINAFVPKPITGSLLLDAITRATGLRPEITPPPQIASADPSFLRDFNILVAEDNEANQFVVREILERAGARVDIAENGLIALEKVRTGKYDLVLMDVQMPEMDGLAATRQIRAEKEGHLPVVALTANALASDFEACLAAGMNDYVAKPIERAALFATLARWLPFESATRTGDSRPSHPVDSGAAMATEPSQEKPTSSEETPSPIPSSGVAAAIPGVESRDPHANADVQTDPGAPPPPVAAPPQPRRKAQRRKAPEPEAKVDTQLHLLPVPPAPGNATGLSAIDIEDAVRRLGLSRDVVEKMLLQFAKGQRATFERIQTAFRKKDSEEVRRLAHAIAGAAGNLSMAELRRLAKTVELAVRYQQGDLESMIGDLLKEATRVLKAIDTLSSPPEAPAGLASASVTPAEVKDFKPALESLKAALADGDVDGIQKAMDVLKQMSVPEALRSDLERVASLAAGFDYDEAARIVGTRLERAAQS